MPTSWTLVQFAAGRVCRTLCLGRSSGRFSTSTLAPRSVAHGHDDRAPGRYPPCRPGVPGPAGVGAHTGHLRGAGREPTRPSYLGTQRGDGRCHDFATLSGFRSASPGPMTEAWVTANCPLVLTLPENGFS